MSFNHQNEWNVKTRPINMAEGEICEFFKPLFMLFNLIGINVSPVRARCRNFLGCVFQIIRCLYFFSFVVVNVVHDSILITLVFEDKWCKIVSSHALIQVLGTAQALMLYRKRLVIRKIVMHLSNTLKPIKPIVGVTEKKTACNYILAAMLTVFAVEVTICTMYARQDVLSLRNNRLPSEYIFYIDVNSTTAEFIAYYSAFCRQMNFIWMETFLVYYCAICWVLRSTFLKFKSILKQRYSYSEYLHIHNCLTKAVLVVDDAYSSQICICYSLQLITMFLQMFLMKQVSQDGIEYYYMFSGWISLTFVTTIIFASSVAEAAGEVKESIQYMNFGEPFDRWGQFYFKVSLADVQLTIWKTISIRRLTILSALGAFFTYTVIIVSL
ncbi:hypothetical protein AVEN_118626-1 [Araneus ventricosus]|uniref:Uncharacterized protein n=1 Tax=Araneus ventricosus TaxID=182803 RepID=A0A4Y2AWJ2_ARAVE|nr:hypothetical protein AVEN_118626-1 [Araneus ventricosus]